MRKIFCLVLIFLCSVSAFCVSDEDTVQVKKRSAMAYSGYQGGMMFNVGYVESRDFQFQDSLPWSYRIEHKSIQNRCDEE